MGNCCGERNTSILEKQLNTIFESLPICNSSIDDFINYYEKKYKVIILLQETIIML